MYLPGETSNPTTLNLVAGDLCTNQAPRKHFLVSLLIMSFNENTLKSERFFWYLHFYILIKGNLVKTDTFKYEHIINVWIL